MASLAVAGAEVGQRARVGGVGLADEVVEQPQQLGRRHALVLLQLEIEEVVEAERAGEAVAQADEIEKAVVEHPALDVAKRVERALPSVFDGIGRDVRRQHRQRRDFRLAAVVDVPRLVGALFFEERRLGVDDVAHQRAALGAVDDVGLEHRQPALEPVEQRVTLAARRRARARRRAPRASSSASPDRR